MHFGSCASRASSAALVLMPPSAFASVAESLGVDELPASPTVNIHGCELHDTDVLVEVQVSVSSGQDSAA